ncbi:MAG: transposase [Oscillospiraceae bacterium]|nr:transposase [Oscillospiraceae bacterium]
MTDIAELPKRKHHRLPGYDYSRNGYYFVTICTEDRKPLFWKNAGADIIRPQNDDTDLLLSETGVIVKNAIENISEHYHGVFVDRYCIMPNHVHLIIAIMLKENGRIISAPTVSRVIGQMKRYASKKCGYPIWQKSFYDEIIRSQSAYDEISEYIFENPMKWEEDELFCR